MTSSTSSKPVILLFHVAWHSASCWSLLIPYLDSAGYVTHPVALPSVSIEDIQDDFTADVTSITPAIASLVDNGDDVAILMHSYGGVPGLICHQEIRKI